MGSRLFAQSETDSKQAEDPAKTTETQDGKKDDTAKSDEANQGTKSYMELMTEWKELEDKLKKLEAEYGAVGSNRQQEIKVEYEKLVDQSVLLVADLRKAAIVEYESKPNVDETLVRLLIGMLTDDLKRNRFDAFFSLGDVLIKGKVDVKHFKAIEKSKRLTSVGIDYPIEELIARHDDAMRDDNPRAVIKTSYGEIEVELFEDAAPNHVANFVKLTEGKFFDGTKWHRVDEAARIIQAGKPKEGKELDYTLADEWKSPKRRRHFKGHLGAALEMNADNQIMSDSAGSEFYIVREASPGLDSKDNSYTVFGRVIRGMDAVQQVKEGGDILSIEMIRKRNHAYEPKPFVPEANKEVPKTDESKKEKSESSPKK